jgi:hypothetical protein
MNHALLKGAYRGMWLAQCGNAPCTEQRRAGDCLQPTLILRFGFRQRLTPGVRLLKLHHMHCWKNVA